MKHAQPIPEYNPKEECVTEITVDHTINTIKPTLKRKGPTIIVTQSQAKEQTIYIIREGILRSLRMEVASDYQPTETTTDSHRTEAVDPAT